MPRAVLEPDDVVDPRLRPPEAPPCAAAVWLAGLETAGGVMRLTVGRENALEIGCAPAPALAPSMPSRVGFTFTRLKACAPFTSLGVTRRLLECTGSPRCSVFCETAVNPPGLFRFEKRLAGTPVLAPRKKLLLTWLMFTIRVLLTLTLWKYPRLTPYHG